MIKHPFLIPSIQREDWLRTPGFWLALIILVGLGIRIWYLSHSPEYFISFFIADDCFYYLNTVVNIVQGHGSSFDGGLTQHNGYHPLFLVLLLAPAWLGVGKLGLLYWAMGILVASTVVCAYAAYRIGCLLGQSVSALCIPILLVGNIAFVKMSFSGFETALAAALTLTTVYLALTRQDGWPLGLSLGLLGLARIEMLALALPLGIYLAVQRKWRKLLITAFTSFLLMTPWFLWSGLQFHSLLPLSGVAKLPPFQWSHIWQGLEHFCTHIPFFLGGYKLRWSLPQNLSYAIGVAIFYRALRDWRRSGLMTGIILLLLLIYSSFTHTGRVPQFIRYLIPAYLLLGVILFSLPRRRIVLLPLLLAGLVFWSSWDFVAWSARTGPLPTFVGLGQSRVPAIMEQIVGPEDLVGCFDSGCIGYFSDVPVINLDGLVNSEVVQMLNDGEGKTWTSLYREYFQKKGITIMVGGMGFSWQRLFPDLAEWEVLHPPLKSTDGGEIVFLRIPPYE